MGEEGTFLTTAVGCPIELNASVGREIGRKIASVGGEPFYCR